MFWVAVLLLGAAITDLTRSLVGSRVLPGPVGGIAAIVTGLLCGVHEPMQLFRLFVVAAAVVAWGVLTDRGSARAALAVFGGAMALLMAIPSFGPEHMGLFEDWVQSGPFVLDVLPAGAGLLIIAVMLSMLSTGNVFVRLVLEATGTSRPGDPDEPAAQLKGGRLLGPMERLFILGFGLIGNFTAAGMVIAAKGLIRWPELQSKRDRDGANGPQIDEITEYFLVGSFLSWMWALGGVILLAMGVPGWP